MENSFEIALITAKVIDLEHWVCHYDERTQGVFYRGQTGIAQEWQPWASPEEAIRLIEEIVDKIERAEDGWVATIDTGERQFVGRDAKLPVAAVKAVYEYGKALEVD